MLKVFGLVLLSFALAGNAVSGMLVQYDHHFIKAQLQIADNKDNILKNIESYEEILRKMESQTLTQSDVDSIYELAKKRNDILLKMILAPIYTIETENIAMDLDKSVELYDDVVLQDDFMMTPNALYELGKIYSNSKFDKYDEQEAYKNYKASANQGFLPAQYALAESYEKGLGTEKDYIKAYVWYSIAMDNGGGKFAENKKNELISDIYKSDIVKIQDSIKIKKNIIKEKIQKNINKSLFTNGERE